MPPPTLTTTISPSVSSISEDVAPKVLSASFGDGYTQRAGDGLNATKRTLAVAWPPMAFADADVLEAFFVARRGYEAFLWASPLVPGDTRKWTAPRWNRSTAGGVGVSMITATFEQVFDLD